MPSDTKWITVNGTHIPIEKGETKNFAVVKFFKKQGAMPTISQTIYPHGNKKVISLYNKLKPYMKGKFTFADINGELRSVPKNKKLRQDFIRLEDKLNQEMKANQYKSRTTYGLENKNKTDHKTAQLHFNNATPEDKKVIKMLQNEFGNAKFVMKKDRYGDEILVPKKNIKRWKELIRSFSDKTQYKLVEDKMPRNKAMDYLSAGIARGLGLKTVKDASPYYIPLEGRDKKSFHKIWQKNNVFYDTYKNTIFASKLNQNQMTKKMGRGYLEIDKNPYYTDSKLKGNSISSYWVPSKKELLMVVGPVSTKEINKKYNGAWRLKR